MHDALIAAIDAAATGAGPLTRQATALHERYRHGRDSRYHGPAGALAYAASRMPATAAAVAAAADALPADRLQACHSWLDLGAGTGAAGWALADRLPTTAAYLGWERDRDAIALGQQLAAAAPADPLRRGRWQQADLHGGQLPAADLVTASYALSELATDRWPGLFDRLWSACRDLLVVVEPGTPAGFALIDALRTEILARGASILAPCPHAQACPLRQAGEWCHQPVRVPRSRLQRQLKGGQRSFEDEKFCYLIASRTQEPQAAARIIQQPKVHKAAVELRCCSARGTLETIVIPRRDARRYKPAKKLRWGDAFEMATGSTND